MSTAYIYSAYGLHERDGKPGHFEYYAGIPWWLPLGKVTTIPNFALRELDHDRSTPDKGGVAPLTYMTLVVPGERIAEELCNKQKPISNRDMGILPITGKPTGRIISVHAGWNDIGQRIMVEVPEREATKAEIAEAEGLADTYKRQMISEYFQSKRERMTGGRGYLKPPAIVRAFMDELGVEDIDDVAAHSKAGGLNLDLLKMIIEATRSATEINYETLKEALESVRKAGKAQVAPTKLSGNRYESKHLDLAANKAKWMAEHPEEAELLGKTPEPATTKDE